MSLESARPSKAWVITMVATLVIASAAALGAYWAHHRAHRPIGEGELFRVEAGAAAESFGITPGVIDERLRRVRNDLAIEAVALVDEVGSVVSSTSMTMVGEPMTNPFLRFAIDEGRFSAVALMSDQPILIDGVEEWPESSPLYAVLQPLDDESSLLLYYDISELLGRRSVASGVQPITIQLAGVSLLFLLLAGVLSYSRAKSARHVREMDLENRLLRDHAQALEATNRETDAARQEAEIAREQAEAAFALAEEKNRVRAEFVLMINHELRTPLTAVVTGAELLASDEEMSASDRDQITGDMVFNGRRLQEIISQMLAVARMENRGLNVAMVPQSGGELLELAAESHPRLEIGDGFNDLAGEVVLTDRATLGHLIGSLVDNAFTHGAHNVRVNVSLDMDHAPQVAVGNKPDSPLYLVISDDGPGIDASFLPRAFEKFEKDSFSSGTGLGLYAAQLMAEAIEASLAISTSRLGTKLIIALPRAGRLAAVAT